jgi:hypothetical protein
MNSDSNFLAAKEIHTKSHTECSVGIKRDMSTTRTLLSDIQQLNKKAQFVQKLWKWDLLDGFDAELIWCNDIV